MWTHLLDLKKSKFSLKVTTDEYIEFYLGKMEDIEDYGNHIVEDYVSPNPDWVIGEDYPRKTLREKCDGS
jgi:hypothetical protein